MLKLADEVNVKAVVGFANRRPAILIVLIVVMIVVMMGLLG